LNRGVLACKHLDGARLAHWHWRGICAPFSMTMSPLGGRGARDGQLVRVHRDIADLDPNCAAAPVPLPLLLAGNHGAGSAEAGPLHQEAAAHRERDLAGIAPVGVLSRGSRCPLASSWSPPTLMSMGEALLGGRPVSLQLMLPVPVISRSPGTVRTIRAERRDRRIDRNSRSSGPRPQPHRSMPTLARHPHRQDKGRDHDHRQ
jgi:hypothetical protein